VANSSHLFQYLFKYIHKGASIIDSFEDTYG